MADKNGNPKETVQTLSDVKVSVNHETQKVKSVQVKDAVVHGVDLEGTLLHLWAHVSTPVRERWMSTFGFGADKTRSAIFLAILYYEKYLPEAQWVMSDDGWDEPIIELLDRFFHDLA